MSRISGFKNNHQWLTEGVSGDFRKAVTELINNLKDGKKSNREMLVDWDFTRGNDWFTQTRKDLTEVDLDDEVSWQEYLKEKGSV